jgi:hypothetical protein
MTLAKAEALVTLLLISVDSPRLCSIVTAFVQFYAMLCFLFFPEDGGSGFH